jgi:outer membrane immunogenic protein
VGYGFAGLPPVVVRRNSLDWFGTTRARAGWAFGNVLAYGTVGFAYGGNGDTNTGLAWGGGVEWALPMTGGLFGSTAVTFKVEALRVEIDGDGGNAFVTSGGTIVIPDGRDHEFTLVRGGVNFKY